jgi:hypothetical protein
VPRSCTTCTHPDREAIDRALVGGASNRSVASLYNVSEAAVRRHKANHLPAKLVMAHAAEEVAQADDLLAEVRSLQARTLSILEAAEAARQLPTALRAIKEARSNVELLARLVGELQSNQLAQQNVQVNVVYEDERRQQIIAELEEFEQRRREKLEESERWKREQDTVYQKRLR